MDAIKEQNKQLKEAREIAQKNLENIQKEQKALHEELDTKTSQWTNDEKAIVSAYYQALDDYQETYNSKIDAARKEHNDAAEEMNEAKEALTQAQAKAYEHYLEHVAEKKAEEEAAAAAAADAAGGGGAVSGGDVSGGVTGSSDATAASADAATSVAGSDTTSSAAGSDTTASVTATGDATTGVVDGTDDVVHTVQSAEQLRTAKEEAIGALNRSTEDLDKIFDGTTTKLNHEKGNKDIALSSFISGLSAKDADAAEAVGKIKEQLDGVESQYRQVRKDIVRMETLVSVKETSLAIASAELESLKGAETALAGVDESGLDEDQQRSLSNLKANLRKAIEKKEKEVDKINNAEINLNQLKEEETRLRGERTNLIGALKEKMREAVEANPELATYKLAYDAAVAAYDREETSALSVIQTSRQEAVNNHATAVNNAKDADLADAQKAGDKYKFDPNQRVELEEEEEVVS
ncbi:MAG: hypothetical protein K6E29_08605 [Cyanobacteria bacterium RUI128]|nr:hypothetical protein [Cyanobacteria bacterium RUI128]